MKRTILTAAAVFVALFFTASATNAATYYFYVDDEGTPGNWNNSNNWYTDSCEEHSVPSGQIPGAGNDAVICPGQTCNVTTSANAKTIEVRVGAELDIWACPLSLGDGKSIVDGAIKLLGDSSILRFMGNHNVVGGGSIGGCDNCAEIQIADGMTLTNAMEFEGRFQIKPALNASNTVFINNGVVHANAIGTFYIAPHSIGVSSGVWKVSTHASAVLQIGAPSANSHTGSVSVSNGALDVDYDFETVGQLTFTNGMIDVATDKTFKASS